MNIKNVILVSVQFASFFFLLFLLNKYIFHTLYVPEFFFW